MRPDKSRSSRRALRRREFDLKLKIICSLISLSGFAKSQVFARLLRYVWKQLKVSPSFGLACRELHTSYFTLTCGEKWAVSFLHWRPFGSLCLHQRLEACRRSRRPLYRRSAAKGPLFAFHRKILIPMVNISNFPSRFFHLGPAFPSRWTSDARKCGGEIAVVFAEKCFGKKSEIWNPFKSFWSALCVFYAWSSSPDVVDKHNHI